MREVGGDDRGGGKEGTALGDVKGTLMLRGDGRLRGDGDPALRGDVNAYCGGGSGRGGGSGKGVVVVTLFPLALLRELSG